MLTGLISTKVLFFIVSGRSLFLPAFINQFHRACSRERFQSDMRRSRVAMRASSPCEFTLRSARPIPVFSVELKLRRTLGQSEHKFGAPKKDCECCKNDMLPGCRQ
jgi:hypothetical protein